MIELGYLAKRIAPCPTQIRAPGVVDVCSVSNCISEDFADLFEHWKHNTFWFYDSPEIIRAICETEDIAESNLSFFYYRAYELQYEEKHRQWKPWAETLDSKNIVQPSSLRSIGFDVVTFWTKSSPEHSPLSCNYLAEEVPVNEHCLLDSFDDAKRLLEEGRFENSEPGPFRIIEVNRFS